MKVIPLAIEEVRIVEPAVFSDSRGYFMETFQRDRYERHGIRADFVQDNLSFSRKGVLRGLHYQIRNPQAKLVQALCGEVFDVAVDVRAGSPTFGRWVGAFLSRENARQMFIPEGFAHGFCVVSESALFSYKCSRMYDPLDEAGILWSDPQLGIRWPLSEPDLSEKDAALPPLCRVPSDRLPRCPAADAVRGMTPSACP